MYNERDAHLARILPTQMQNGSMCCWLCCIENIHNFAFTLLNIYGIPNSIVIATTVTFFGNNYFLNGSQDKNEKTFSINE